MHNLVIVFVIVVNCSVQNALYAYETSIHCKKEIKKLSRAPFKNHCLYIYIFTIKYNYYNMLNSKY